MFFYVDTREMLSKPKKGKQFIVWYSGGSINYPEGYPFIDTLNGEDCQLRSMDKGMLERFVRMAYSRAPYLKVTEFIELEVDH